MIVNVFLRGILLLRQRLCPRNLNSSTCLCLQFLKKKLAKKERWPAFAGIETGTMAQESLGYLPEPSASWRMQVEKDRSSNFRDCMHRLPVQAPQWLALETNRQEEKHPSKISKLISLCPGVYHESNKSLALAFIRWKKPRHKTLACGSGFTHSGGTLSTSYEMFLAMRSSEVQRIFRSRVLYCLSFFSADKRSGSGIYCIHKKLVGSMCLNGSWILNLVFFILRQLIAMTK